MECRKRYRNPVWWLLGLVLVLACPVTAKASSGMIQFTTASTQVQKGDTFTVVCQVTSSEAFLDTEFTVGYNPDAIRFIKGGSKVTGGEGEIRISSTGNTTAANKKTFSLQFAAQKKGGTSVAVEGEVRVVDADGNAFSMSSNRLFVTVTKKKPAEPTLTPTAAPVVTPAPVLSSDNRLRELKTSAYSMTPAFSAGTKEYRAVVDCDTDILYFTYVPEDEKARVKFIGNDNLVTGLNTVQVVVTAEDGKENKYTIQVTKETERETREREKKGTDKDISFTVTKENDVIRMRNSYDFEVLDVSSMTSVPAGYIESSIELDGISVPAFTMENDLDNNYLLLYLKGPSGESSLYQFDRSEKTLQKYTGSMIEKVNKGAGQTQKEEMSIDQNHVMIGIIVGLVILILCLLIAMLKMAIEKRKERP